MTISSPSCSLLYLFLAERGDDNLHLQEQIRRAKTDIITGSLKLFYPAITLISCPKITLQSGNELKMLGSPFK